MSDPVGTAGNDAVGIMGGTFDPVHLAHLALARAALDRLGLGQVLWIPAGRPPHRDPPRAAPADRLAMVRAAIAGEPRFALDDSETHGDAPSFTVRTLERLRRQLGHEQPLVLLMGADAFRGLATWYRWQEIFSLAHIAVATRPGFPVEDFAPPLAAEFAARRLAGADFAGRPAGGIHTFELVAGTVSATEARALIAAGASDARLLELLPAPVLDYIRRNDLYRR
jgi:nicotinate-nucleotide adenylyltransferase